MNPFLPLLRGDFFQLLFERSPVALVVMDPETHRYLACNEAAAQIYGLATTEALLGRTPADMSPPLQSDGLDSASKAKTYIGEALDHGSVSFEWLNCRPDGSRWNSEVRLMRIRVEETTLLYFSIQEITGVKRTEEALKDTEAKYRELFELNPAPMLIYARRGLQVLATNEALQRHYGYTREELESMILTDLYPEDERPKIAELITRLRGHAYVGEWHHRRKDGSYIEIVVHSHDILYLGQQARIGVITDITDLKKAEKDRQDLQRQLLQAQKMEAVGQLAGGVAHDFNNILTAILMQIDLMREEPGLSTEMIHSLHDMGCEVKKASDLTRHLLAFSRRQVMQPKAFDLNSILGNFVKMLRRLIGENIRLQFAQAAKDLWLEADPNMLEQVVMNLAVNARDAMPRGGILSISTGTVTLDDKACQRMPGSYPGNFVYLAIKDTGSGMSGETLKHIFEPFFTTKEAGKGTGLGLATVYGIMQQHRGWVAVETAVGAGSTFTIYFPEAKRLPAAFEVRPEDRSIPGGHENILFVEDEASLRQAVPAMLKKLGYTIRVAANGHEAIREWNEVGVRIDLVVSDVIMPGGITGLDLADRFTRQKPGLKVVLMSGYSSEMAANGFSRGPNVCFISKPFTASELAKLIRGHLDKA